MSGAVLTPAQRAFVVAAPVGRLATVDAAGAPHVVPVCFALIANRVYSVVDEKPKRTTALQRLRNVAAHPAAALVVDHYDNDWSRLGWVMLRGHAAVVDAAAEAAAAERAQALAALRAKYPQYRAMALEGRPLLRLRVERVNGWGRLGGRV